MDTSITADSSRDVLWNLFFLMQQVTNNGVVVVAALSNLHQFHHPVGSLIKEVFEFATDILTGIPNKEDV